MHWPICLAFQSYHPLALPLAQASSDEISVFVSCYSTVAQTLAGAFGFLAAIVLYRLQALNEQLRNIASQLIGDPREFHIEPFRTLFAYHRWTLFVMHVKRDQDASNRNPVFKDLNFLDLGAMDYATGQILSIRRWFVIAMIMTVTTISLCLIALFAMVWGHNSVYLISMLVLALMCLAAYARLMLIVLQ